MKKKLFLPVMLAGLMAMCRPDKPAPADNGTPPPDRDEDEPELVEPPPSGTGYAKITDAPTVENFPDNETSLFTEENSVADTASELPLAVAAMGAMKSRQTDSAAEVAVPEVSAQTQPAAESAPENAKDSVMKTAAAEAPNPNHQTGGLKAGIQEPHRMTVSTGVTPYGPYSGVRFEVTGNQPVTPVLRVAGKTIGMGVNVDLGERMDVTGMVGQDFSPAGGYIAGLEARAPYVGAVNVHYVQQPGPDKVVLTKPLPNFNLTSNRIRFTPVLGAEWAKGSRPQFGIYPEVTASIPIGPKAADQPKIPGSTKPSPAPADSPFEMTAGVSSFGPGGMAPFPYVSASYGAGPFSPTVVYQKHRVGPGVKVNLPGDNGSVTGTITTPITDASRKDLALGMKFDGVSGVDGVELSYHIKPGPNALDIGVPVLDMGFETKNLSIDPKVLAIVHHESNHTSILPGISITTTFKGGKQGHRK